MSEASWLPISNNNNKNINRDINSSAFYVPNTSLTYIRYVFNLIVCVCVFKVTLHNLILSHQLGAFIDPILQMRKWRIK